ncbi:MAG: hypothetical protein WCV93_02050 [Candidatus Shapirobacteria bacterium]|jgi:hypothetical protein
MIGAIASHSHEAWFYGTHDPNLSWRRRLQEAKKEPFDLVRCFRENLECRFGVIGVGVGFGSLLCACVLRGVPQ